MLLRIITNVRNLRWDNAILELIVVAVGLLMAFQIDRWWEARHERETEQLYIDRLIDDLESDLENLEFGVAAAELRLSFARLLMDVAERPELATQSPVDFTIAVQQAAFTYTPALTSNTFDELRSTGNLGLLRDTQLKNSLFDYHRFDEGQRQFQSLQLMQEIRHFEFAAGVLSNQQLRRANEDWGIVNADELETFRTDTVDLLAVQAAAERLQANDRFVAWLPIAHQMQLELARINRERQQRANVLLEILRELQIDDQATG